MYPEREELQHQDWNGLMAMKAQTKRWVFAVGIAGSLLAILFYLDRSAATEHATHVVHLGHRVAPLPGPAPGAAAPAPRGVADPVRERYIVQAASAGEAATAVVRAGGKVTGDLSVIRAVSASLDERELDSLRAQSARCP
jgi:hypothetical protein